MMPALNPRARLVTVGRWLAPSVIGACLAAVIAGLVEGWLADFGAAGAPASAGFAALFAVPVCFVLAMVVRGLWAAWRPARLAPGLIEEGGGAPRLAAWLLYLAVAAFLLSWATFNSVGLVAKQTSFKPNVVALLVPAVVVPFALILVTISRPVVDLIAAGLRALDRRLAPKLRRSMLAPRVLLGGSIAISAGLGLFAWFITLKPRLGDLDGGIFIHPILAFALTAAAHPIWRRLAPRLRLAAMVAPAVVGTLGVAFAALWVRAERPSLLLAIWAEPTIGGLAVDTFLDIDDLRDKAMMEKYRPVPKDGATPRSIVLVTIDTVRWDHTPLGGGHAPMPTLAGLARRGVVFENTISAGNTTRRSLPAMILGRAPTRIRGRVVGWALKLDPRHVPLGERFHAAGYDTAGFFCCESFWLPEKKTGYSRGLDSVFIDPDGADLAEEARKWIAKHFSDADAAPAFVWLHFFEPHQWQHLKNTKADTAPGPDSRWRKYDRALAEVDDDLAGLVAAIDAVPEARRPILVITSDHGEGLGEHGHVNHSSDLFQSQVHVPWLVEGPGLENRRVRETVSGADLAPTVLELAGFVPPGMPDMDGRSDYALATGAQADDPDGGYAFSVMVKDRSTPTSARAVTRGRWKLIESDDGLALYDLRDDPGETHDLAGERTDVLDDMRQLLEERAQVESAPPF